MQRRYFSRVVRCSNCLLRTVSLSSQHANLSRLHRIAPHQQKRLNLIARPSRSSIELVRSAELESRIDELHKIAASSPDHIAADSHFLNSFLPFLCHDLRHSDELPSLLVAMLMRPALHRFCLSLSLHLIAASVQLPQSALWLRQLFASPVDDPEFPGRLRFQFSIDLHSIHLQPLLMLLLARQFSVALPSYPSARVMSISLSESMRLNIAARKLKSTIPLSPLLVPIDIDPLSVISPSSTLVIAICHELMQPFGGLELLLTMPSLEHFVAPLLAQLQTPPDTIPQLTARHVLDALSHIDNACEYVSELAAQPSAPPELLVTLFTIFLQHASEIEALATSADSLVASKQMSSTALSEFAQNSELLSELQIHIAQTVTALFHALSQMQFESLHSDFLRFPVVALLSQLPRELIEPSQRPSSKLDWTLVALASKPFSSAASIPSPITLSSAFHYMSLSLATRRFSFTPQVALSLAALCPLSSQSLLSINSAMYSFLALPQALKLSLALITGDPTDLLPPNSPRPEFQFNTAQQQAIEMFLIKTSDAHANWVRSLITISHSMLQHLHSQGELVHSPPPESQWLDASSSCGVTELDALLQSFLSSSATMIRLERCILKLSLDSTDPSLADRLSKLHLSLQHGTYTTVRHWLSSLSDDIQSPLVLSWIRFFCSRMLSGINHYQRSSVRLIWQPHGFVTHANLQPFAKTRVSQPLPTHPNPQRVEWLIDYRFSLILSRMLTPDRPTLELLSWNSFHSPTCLIDLLDARLNQLLCSLTAAPPLMITAIRSNHKQRKLPLHPSAFRQLLNDQDSIEQSPLDSQHHMTHNSFTPVLMNPHRNLHPIWWPQLEMFNQLSAQFTALSPTAVRHFPLFLQMSASPHGWNVRIDPKRRETQLSALKEIPRLDMASLTPIQTTADFETLPDSPLLPLRIIIDAQAAVPFKLPPSASSLPTCSIDTPLFARHIATHALHHASILDTLQPLLDSAATILRYPHTELPSQPVRLAVRQHRRIFAFDPEEPVAPIDRWWSSQRHIIAWLEKTMDPLPVQPATDDTGDETLDFGDEQEDPSTDSALEEQQPHQRLRGTIDTTRILVSALNGGDFRHLRRFYTYTHLLRRGRARRAPEHPLELLMSKSMPPLSAHRQLITRCRLLVLDLISQLHEQRSEDCARVQCAIASPYIIYVAHYCAKVLHHNLGMPEIDDKIRGDALEKDCHGAIPLQSHRQLCEWLDTLAALPRDRQLTIGTLDCLSLCCSWMSMLSLDAPRLAYRQLFRHPLPNQSPLFHFSLERLCVPLYQSTMADILMRHAWHWSVQLNVFLTCNMQSHICVCPFFLVCSDIQLLPEALEIAAQCDGIVNRWTVLHLLQRQAFVKLLDGARFESLRLWMKSKLDEFDVADDRVSVCRKVLQQLE